MSTLAVTRIIVALLLTLSGCSAAAPDVYRGGLQKFKLENPDQYEVDSKSYLTYRIESSIYRPPSGIVKGMTINHPKDEMRTTDIWRVTHIYNGYYYIFSDEYQKRHVQENKESKINEAGDYYLYHLPIDKEGHVVGGWVYFKNRKLVPLSDMRKIVLDPSYWRNPRWDKQPSFKQIENQKQ